ncbi:MAG: response regulator receiver protein [Bacteroidota bacterium]|nr:response regulator receiver protein [Bacteroidota bacterium]
MEENKISADSNEPIKIIMADDDHDDQEMFQEAVDEAKVPVDLTMVDNGQQLMDNLHDPEEANPDIIFLDINMPVKNGKQCLEEIKKDDDLKDIPTVMYTTSTHPTDIEETFESGANLYVPKPNSFQGLVLIIKKIFSMDLKEIFKPMRRHFILSEKDVKGN